jgi:hypothetical protein
LSNKLVRVVLGPSKSAAVTQKLQAIGTMEISTQIRKSYFMVKLGGKFDHELTQSFFDDILWNCKLNNLTRLLIDCRKIKGGVFAPHRAMMGGAGVKSFRAYFDTNQDKFKMAIVEGELFLDSSATDSSRFAGIDVMLTHVYDIALEWINE